MLQYPDLIVFSGGPLEFKSLALRYDEVSVNHWTNNALFLCPTIFPDLSHYRRKMFDMSRFQYLIKSIFVKCSWKSFSLFR